MDQARPPVVSPKDDAEKQPTLGLIGMGAMGKMYANLLSKAGWKKYVVFFAHRQLGLTRGKL